MTCQDCKDFKKIKYPKSVYEYLPEDDVTKTHGLCMGALSESMWVNPNGVVCPYFKPVDESESK